MSYELSVIVYGLGTDPQYRSHWGFIISQVGQPEGELLHVKLLDLPTLRYQFETRDTLLNSASCKGRWRIASLTYQQRLEAKEIISKEKAPADGKSRCQDWVFEVFLGLEAEGLIPAGSSQRCKDRIGKSADDLAASLGAEWVKS
ncbi:hypothetical protein MMC31_001473 [Peltigera leucophlebia]|nr:hypothetical protein [Peltigera leucophlebia]